MSDAPKYVLSGIPNNDVGLAFIDQLRSFTNYERFRIRVRGNGPRVAPALKAGLRRTAYAQDIPLAKAATLRVYIEDKTENETYERHVRIIRELREENAILTRNVQDLQALQQTIQHDAHLAYSRGWKVAHERQAKWFGRMPKLLRQALTYLYGEI